MVQLVELGVAAAVEGMQRGDFTAESYAEALIKQAARAASLNSCIFHDPDAVRQAARQADLQRRDGAAPKRLHGIPLVFKDNLGTRAIPTTAGTPGLANNRPEQDAVVVRRLLDQGAIVFGKSNMHELAFGITNHNSAFGAARNPYDPGCIPGGSSGGTAVSVAARMVPAGIGTDTGGSVRVPAALCGVTGFRPTTGRWPQTGSVPISHTRDTPGPITRSVADCQLLDTIVTGSQIPAKEVKLHGLRLGVPRGYFWDPLDDEVQRICESVLSNLRDAGAVLVEADIENVAALDQAASFPIALYEGIKDLERYLAERRIDIDLVALIDQIASPDVKGAYQSQLGPDAVSESVYREALKVHRVALQQTYQRYFTEYGVAAVLFPTTPRTAARIGEDEFVQLAGKSQPAFATFIRNTDPGSVAGLPGLSLPAGTGATGLPIGIGLDAAAGTDEQLLAIGSALEKILPPLAPPAI